MKKRGEGRGKEGGKGRGKGKPWLSIVVPTLNEEKIIASTLTRLRELAPDAELIVADGRSTDHTQEIARRLADKVVCEVRRGEHRSIGAGRNAGARAARADIILFNDADTIPEPEFFDEAKRAFEDPRVVGVGCKIIPAQVGVLSHAVFAFFNFLIWVSVKIRRPAIAGNCVAYRKKAFWEIGGFDEEMEASEDQDLCVRISRLGRVRLLSGITASTSSRRLKKLGWFGLFIDWGKTTLNFILGRKTKRYAIIREV